MRGWERALRWAYAGVAGSLVTLALTGAALLGLYRPDSPDAWDTIHDLDDGPGFEVEDLFQGLHVWASRVLLLSGVALGVAAVGRASASRSAPAGEEGPGSGFRRRVRARVPYGLPTGVGVALTALSGGFTGLLLAFDQVALRSVTVGDSWQGVIRPAFSSNVRFLLVDGREVSQAAFRFWLVVHLALPLLAVAVAVAFTARRRHPSH